MVALIGWVLTLGPIIFALLKKFLPKLFSRLGGKAKGLTGNAEGLGPVGGTLVGADVLLSSTAAKTGVMGLIVVILGRIWSWCSRFTGWFKGLFAAGGTLAFIRPVLEFMLGCFKTPILLAISLVTSVIFPTILEKIFLTVGAVVMHIFLWVFKLGKNVFLGAMSKAGSDGGSAVSEFQNAVLSSFDELPPCMVEVLGYLHLIEDLGLIVTTATLIALVSVFRIVYGSFVVRPLGYFS